MDLGNALDDPGVQGALKSYEMRKKEFEQLVSFPFVVVQAIIVT
jgi:hypothetical protein